MKALLLEPRAPFLTVSLLPVLAGMAAAAHQTHECNGINLALTLLTFGLFHLGANVMNDYWDDRNGTDRSNHEFIFPLTGGSRLIQQGLLTPKTVWRLGAVLYTLGWMTGILLAWRTPVLLAVWGFAFISGVFYTAPPWRWAHRGWGEILVFMNFGPLPVLTAYYVQTGQISALSLLLSLPIGLLATAILYINQFPDYAADLAFGKRNWVVRLGRPLARWGYALLILLAYASMIGMITQGWLPPFAWLALAGLPLVIVAIKTLWQYHSTPARLALACRATIALHLVAGLALCLALWVG